MPVIGVATYKECISSHMAQRPLLENSYLGVNSKCLKLGMPTGGGVCVDVWLCSDEASITGGIVGLLVVALSVWFAKAWFQTLLATWLMVASSHRLVWGIPVIGSRFQSVSDLTHMDTDWSWLYTRQIYVPLELAILNLGFYSTVMQYPATTYITAAYWTAAVWVSVQYWNDPAASLYTIHDIAGLFLGALWLFSGPRLSKDNVQYK